MKTFRESVKFQFRMYLISNKMLVPFIVLIAFLYFNYNQRPLDLIANYNVSAVVCFYLMFWIGLVYNDVTDVVTEQLLVLKLKGHHRYYLCNDVVMCMVGGMFALTAVIYSLIACPGETILKLGDVSMIRNIIYAIFIHFAASFAGAMTGTLFHGRIFGDRKVMMCLAFVLAIIGIAKDLVVKAVSGFEYAAWIFPPVAEFVKLFKNAANLYGVPVLKGVAYMFVYGMVIAVIRDVILVKRKF